MSENRKFEIARARAKNIDASISAWMRGDGPRPTLRKEPSELIFAVFRKYDLDAGEFYPLTMSNKAKQEVMKEKRSKWRDKYGGKAKDSSGIYKGTGEQKRFRKYEDLSDADRLTAHEEHFIKLDIRDGLRCAKCRKFFSEGDAKKVLESSCSSNKVYLHEWCLEAFVRRTRGEPDEKEE